MKEPKVIDILGTDYQVLFRESEDDKKLEQCDGYFDYTENLIVVGIFKKDDMTVGNLEIYQKKVLRHEIVHAFLYESGLFGNSGGVEHWATSEEMTDWFAIQAPKIFKVFQDAGLLV